MRKFKSIASILLLGIYSVVVLHNIVPHFHCDSDSKMASTESSHHFHAGLHHSHNHDDHDHHETEPSWFDSFLDLLGDLEHHELGEGHFENFTAQNQNFTFDFQLIDLANNDFTFEYNLAYSIITDKHSDYINRPPIIYEQYHRCSSPLRGPPSIS